MKLSKVFVSSMVDVIMEDQVFQRSLKRVLVGKAPETVLYATARKALKERELPVPRQYLRAVVAEAVKKTI